MTAAILMPVGQWFAAADALITPGQTITVGKQNGKTSVCTAGPVVRLSDGSPAVVTSGHCGDNGDEVTFDSTVPAARMERRVDQRIDGVIHDYTVVPVRTGTASPVIAGKYPQSGFLRMDELRVLGNQLGGMELCSVGAKSRERCGPMVRVDYGRGEIVADFISVKGDSGGPVFVKTAEGTALVVGILMGYRTDGTNYSVIVPIESAMDTYNLTVDY